jgi:hypothetical protein
MRRGDHLARIGQMKNAYKILVGKPEGTRPLVWRRCVWDDNTKMYLKGIGYKYVDWFHVAQYRDQWRALVNTVMKLRVS